MRDDGDLDEVVAIEIGEAVGFLDRTFTSFIKVELAFDKLQINLKIKLAQLTGVHP